MASSADRLISVRRKKWKHPIHLMYDLWDRKVSKLQRWHISVVGDEETGRHTLVRRFLNMNEGPFQEPETRRGRYRDIHDIRDIVLNLSERPHIQSQRNDYLRVIIFNFQELDLEAMHRTIAEADSIAVIFDVGRGSTLHTAVQSMVKISGLLGNNAPKFILVGNKIDLPQREVLVELGRRVAETCKAQRYYECSAQRNVNMDAVFDAVLIMALYPYAPLPQ